MADMDMGRKMQNSNDEAFAVTLLAVFKDTDRHILIGMKKSKSI